MTDVRELIERLRKRAAQERSYAENSTIVADLLQPQMDKFEARAGDDPWNTYAVRMAVDHRQSAKKETAFADDLETAATALEREEALRGENARLRRQFDAGTGPDDPANCPAGNIHDCCGFHEECRIALEKTNGN